jgi:hypothetical protein
MREHEHDLLMQSQSRRAYIIVNGALDPRVLRKKMDGLVKPGNDERS